MLELPGYKILEVINERKETAIYRALEIASQKIVILKTIRNENLLLQDIAPLYNEYRILLKLHGCPGIIQILDLYKHENSVYLVFDNIEGVTLKYYLHNEPLPIEIFFTIAIKLLNVLTEVHKYHVIHKDINPENIIIRPEDLSIDLIDFDIATELTSTKEQALNPNQLNMTLAYMSPEQSGRLNREVDYRTDIYSLGITFFEMLTGRLPFVAKDPMEYVHAHIAKIPPLVSAINKDVPDMIAQIIVKMLAKNPEERYQSILGISFDLIKCQRQWQLHNTIIPFSLGQEDFSQTLLISPKLYGRKQQVDELIKAFERISRGKVEFIYISGFSGVGKTSLVNEIHKPIIKARGYFASGKFEKLQHNIPYNGFIKAFNQLIKQILGESSEVLDQFKQSLIARLGINGQVIIDVIPALEFIIGKQPPVIELHTIEAQNRFQMVFQNFVRAFTQPNHPLVLFLMIYNGRIKPLLTYWKLYWLMLMRVI